ncbi:DUF7338 family protein [Deefgea piscis]|uniref:DUF7338 family protein n=1 Tax=Deefgea piscis TaxID=2739061 RepID=UPI001C805EE3|nr:hypothetical protein [Deefgea piscis]QZA80226.1 hypothetical protein K4H25_11850 [Deefgea piscis]
MMWPFLAVMDVLFTVLAMLLAPVIALFVRRDGYLPRWLWWFQTPDSRMDGCNGDAGFCASHTASWWTYVLWQWRNPAAGFSFWLGQTFDRPTLRHWGNLQARRVPTYIPGAYLTLVTDQKGRCAFEFSATWPSLFGRCINIRVGWKLGNLLRDPTERIPICHRFSPLMQRGKTENQPPAKAGFFTSQDR